MANSLPKNLKIAWRFFGFELCERRKDIFISKKTMHIIKTKDSKKNKIKIFIKDNLIEIVNNFIYPKRNFIKAVKRCDFFLGLFETIHCK